MDMCLITMSGTCVTNPNTLPSGRVSFILEFKYSEQQEKPDKVIVMAEKGAVTTIPQAGDYVVIANAKYYDDTRAGAKFGAFAQMPGTVNVAAHFDGVIPAEKLLK